MSPWLVSLVSSPLGLGGSGGAEEGGLFGFWGGWSGEVGWLFLKLKHSDYILHYISV